jgi:type IV secretory pathway VirJ component
VKQVLALVVLCCAAWLPAPGPAQERLSHGLFEQVSLYRPKGEPRQFVLFLSGDDGWNRHAAGIARVLVERGAMVAGIDTPRLFAKLEADGGDCAFPDGDLENLAHYVQGYAHLSTYHTPLLAGYSSGATFAYAMLAQAPRGTFAGALTLGFCPDLELEKPLCQGEGTHFRRHRRSTGMDLLPARTPLNWTNLQGANDQVCPAPPAQRFASRVPSARFVLLPDIAHRYDGNARGGRDWQPQLAAGYEQLAASNTAALPPPPTDLAGLPLVEVPPARGGRSDTFAILLSGDGGWAGLDKQVAAALAAKGIAVVGLDSLRYFWSRRTPAGLAGDLDRVLRYYAAHWQRGRALLVGYSQGADVLPAAVNRLPAASRALVAQTVLMGLGQKASWEFHVGNWLGADRNAVPILPEASKLEAATTLCLYGADEKDSLCPALAGTSVTARELPGGHHFDGAYNELVELILARLR